MMRNLVSNAIKFSTPGNEILVELKAEQNKSLNSTTLKVKDAGIGMDKSVVERLNGNRIVSTVGTQEEVGLGIGLSIVFDIINEHNFTYNIKSEENKGTMFAVNIPMVSH